MRSINIIKAPASSAATISALAVRSKAHWGYSDDFIQAVTAELSYSETELLKHLTYLAQIEQQTVGFYQLVALHSSEVELEALFVEPDHIGTGIGRALFEHAVAQARRAGYQRMHIQSDPYAADFYTQQGCVQVGAKASLSIPGRMLPLMHYDLL